MNKVMVSIWCLTFNHKEYIRDAIEGCLHQKTNFEFEILIHDDASTDGTSDIIQEYVQKYPNKIKAIIQKDNIFCKSLQQWYQRMSDFMMKESLGKYVALCEGDDFWLDIHKLQLQVDYMQNNKNCVLCAHNAIILDSQLGRITKVMNPYDRDKDVSVEELIMWYNGNLPTASCVFKREVALREDFFIATTPSGDWEHQLYCVTKGQVHYMDRIMSCYRANVTESYTHQIWEKEEKRIAIRISHIHFLKLFNKYTNKKYNEIIKEKQYIILETILSECLNLTEDEFEKLLDNIYTKQGYGDSKIIEGIKQLFKQMKNNNNCSEIIKSFCEQYKNIYIMGAGKWAREIAKRMIANGLEFEAFLVSDGKKHEKVIFGKNVFEVKELSINAKTSGIIIAVNSQLYREVKEMLYQRNMYNLLYFLAI